MRPAEGEPPLRIALVHHSFRSPPASGAERLVHDLATALSAAGHRTVVLSSHGAPSRRSLEDGVAVVRTRRLPEALLLRRGFAGPLGHVPLTVRALMTGRYDVAHAFPPVDALAGVE